MLQFGLISIIFFSVCGFGKIIATKLLDKSNIHNLFIAFFLGLILLFIIQFFLYFFLSINYYTNLLILFFGLFLFFYKNKFNNDDLKLFFFLLFSLFLIFLISKTHEDFKHHHLQSVLDLFNTNLTFGKANINPAFIYIPSLSYIIAATNYPYFETQTFHIIPYLIYISFLGYILKPIINNFYNKDKKINYLFPLLVFFILLQFKYLKKFGFDIPALIFSLIFFLESIKNNNFFKNIIFFIYAVSIKITSVFLFPVVLFFLINFFVIKKKIQKFALFFSIILIFFIVISNFINNGCLFYLIKETCFEKENVSWVINRDKLSQISKQTELDTKGYYQQSEFKESEYLDNFNWFKYWFYNGFIYKISNFILLFIFTFFVILFFLKIKFNIDKKYFYLWLSSIICVSLWFFKIPILRYGVTPLLIFFISTLIFFYNINNNLLKINNKIIVIIFTAILFNNILNLKRINDEFKRPDANFFSDFPNYYLPERKYSSKRINKFILNLPDDNYLYPCWNIPNQCVENKNLIIDNRQLKIISKNLFNLIYAE